METIYLLRKNDAILKQLNSSLWDLPTPSVASYFWNFGSMLGVCLMIQILTGLFLSFHYVSYSMESFSSVVEIMREVWSGWLIRFLHMNGASLFFIFIYLHLFRGIYFFSSTHKKVWSSGVLILITLMAISFLGYVLPWGQMSYWGVAVITNLFSVVPMIGEDLVHTMWGGFSVSSPTLVRFYSFHFFLPFVLSFFVLIHLVFLHKRGSSNSLGLMSDSDKISFHPYFTVKDFYFFLLSMVLFSMIIIFSPLVLGDPVNNIPANFMQTPVHIQPEWYFLCSYAILRAMPSKVTGVIFLALSVSIFFIFPFFNYAYSVKFSILRSILFWSFFFSFIFLIKMGSLPAEEPYVLMSKIGSFFYFSTLTFLYL